MQMTVFVIALLVLVVAVGALLVAVFSRDKGGPIATTVIAGILGGLLLFAAGANSVPQKNVGIVTSFNKATGETTGAGFHYVAPWKNVEDWEAGRQSYDVRHGDGCVLGDQRYPGVKVRIANLSDACVEGLVEWNTKVGKASEQWASYKKEFGRFTSLRVDPNIAGAFNDAFSTHDPLQNIDAKDGRLNVPLDPFAKDVKTKVGDRIGDDIEVLNVIVTRVNYDPRTQQQIEAFQQAVLKGRVLEKDQANALLQKTVTETNAKVDPTTRCLELAEKLGKEPGYCMWRTGNLAVPADK